jgi:aminopeptidase N
VTTIRFRSRTLGASTFLDVAPVQLRSVRLNGAPIDVSGYDPDARRLALSGLRENNELIVDAVMAYSHDGEGLHRHVDVADGRPYLYAMSFLDAAPRWFACFDQPDLKAPVTMSVHCPPDWVVSGNGPATAVASGHWRIAATGPLAPYFTTLVAGPYHAVRDEHDGIPLVLLARRSLAEHLDREAPELFATTKHCFDELHRLFGRRYPWGEYHQAFVPDFNAGAMENPGCVTLRDGYVFRSRATESDRLERQITIAHEMAHMWFGDLVTMRWWDDLWLNESFAEYLGQRVIGPHAWVSFGAVRKAWGHAADRRPSTHPVAGNDATDAAAALAAFDGISYAKGASVLRQLALHLGDEAFLAGLRRYVERHAYANAEFADLLAAWKEGGAADVDAWADAWLRTTGLDELTVESGALVVRNPSGPERPHTVSIAPLDPAGAVLLPDAQDETWAKVVLPASAWDAMPGLLPAVADARTRIATWNALRLATADAEVHPNLALDIVVAALPHEIDDAVVGSIARWATGTVVATYLDESGRSAAQARLAAALWEMASASAPGSGRQLAAARAAFGVSDDVPSLRRWLGGNSLPDGLVLDTELRWAIVRRLAALGALDDAAIAAELARDHSSSGLVHAAYCRAARPDADAKAAAWAAITTDAERSNYELYALAEGFWQPEQRPLAAGYVAAYFRDLPAASELRSGWITQRLALRAYPWTVVSPATLAATEDLLAAGSLPALVQRSVVDAGDDLRRALAVRQRFGLAPDAA